MPPTLRWSTSVHRIEFGMSEFKEVLLICLDESFLTVQLFSEMETDRVTDRVEILRPAGQAG